ncbi:MAG: type II toxin-antitoxin system VapB family antitoxin [Bacteroidetes bacterium]|nr:type II toxin-antitoxin system VapB family antitoxin [Bacteroidota bacterium]
MATNLDIDQELLEEALKIGGQKTKKNTVNKALKEFIDKRKQKEIISTFGSILYEPGYDYKKLRRRR